MKEHNLIGLLKGRDADTLKEWLKHHKKITLVTRDRANAYAAAINEIFPDCIQVADRFHLLANLIEKMRDIFRVEVPEQIFVKDEQILDFAPEKVKKLKVSPALPLLNQYEYDNTIPLDKNGAPVSYDNKKRDFDSEQYKRQAENREKNKI